LELLWAKTPQEAERLAGNLKSMNESRKEMTLQQVDVGIRKVEESDLIRDKVLVVYLSDCHESLAGIIAGRIREHYHKPAFVLTDTIGGVKGSGRSIEAYSMYDELVRCADLLDQFGGHPMAAGLSLHKENVEKLRRRLNQNCSLQEEDFVEKVTIDVAMPISYIHRGLIDELDLLQPFGKGNPKPLFAQKNLSVLECRVFGKNRNVVKMKIMDENGASIDGVYFGDSQGFVERVEQEERLSIVYYPTVNVYQGRSTLQVVVSYYR
jgi:single-stranded-DNA-specific exonuclease